jgi:uncharacterized membrane protein
MEIIQQNENPVQAQLPAPTVSGAFGHGWVIMKKNFPELLLVLFIEMLLSIPVGLTPYIFNMQYTEHFTTGLFDFIYSLLILMPVGYGMSWVFLKAVRGEPFQVQEIFFAYQRFGNVLLANLLVAIIIGIGIVMLIVPGIIFACKLAFVPYLVMDRKMEAVDAIRESWHMTTGHAGTIFLMGLTCIPVVLGGIICFFIGIFPAVIWINLAFATIYLVVDDMASQEKRRTS